MRKPSLTNTGPNIPNEPSTVLRDGFYFYVYFDKATAKAQRVVAISKGLDTAGTLYSRLLREMLYNIARK